MVSFNEEAVRAVEWLDGLDPDTVKYVRFRWERMGDESCRLSCEAIAAAEGLRVEMRKAKKKAKRALGGEVV